MGLSPEEKKFLRKTFGDAFKTALGFKDKYSICIIDFMQYVKVIADKVETVNDAINYFADFVKNLIRFPQCRFREIIILVDGKPMDVKRMVCHVERYNEKKIKVREYVPNEPVLPRDRSQKLRLSKWMEFAGNYQLLQRELYPLLFNEFMFNIILQEGQKLILSGFPGRSWYVKRHNAAPWESHDATNQELEVHPWRDFEWPITPEMEEKDPELYHRVYIMERIPQCPEFPTGAIKRYEWEEAKNDISEADVRLLFFERWYQHENIVFSINDGDIYSIALLYARERHLNISPDGTYEFRNKHVVMMKHKYTAEEVKEREDNGVYINDGGKTYLDVNLFYQQVCEYEPMRKGYVQNAVASLVFLLIMSGSDFFKRPKGITGTIIRRVFFENIPVFSHLVQLSNGVLPDTRTRRKIIVDEELFRRFLIFCFLENYEPGLLKKSALNNKVTFNQLSTRTKHDAKGKVKEDKGYHLPTRNGARVLCRQVLWNLDYWINGPRGKMPNPYEMWHGIPYYPYWINPETGKPTIIDCVSTRIKPVDQVFRQHFIRDKKRKQDGLTSEQKTEQKRQAVKDLEYMLNE